MAQNILWIPEKNSPTKPPAPQSRRRALVLDAASGRMVEAVDDLGNPVVERMPAAGHTGPVNNAVPVRVRRSREFLRFDGNVVAVALTGAPAASVGTDQSHGQYLAAKATHEGWIEAHTCPVDAAMSGAIRQQRLVSDEARRGFTANERCKPWRHGEVPCKHFIAEEKARKDRNAAKDRERIEATKSDGTKAAEVQASALMTLAETLAARELAADKSDAKKATEPKAK